MTSSSSSASSSKPAAKLTDFKALTFDCYGTLIDWESGMVEALKPLTSKASRKLTRDRHSRSACAPRILAAGPDAGQSLSRPAGDRLSAPGRGVGRRHELERLRRLWPVGPELAAFADTVASLQYLKRHYKLAILSNVDNESFSFSNEKLGVDFDAVYTAEDCGSYKPSHPKFRLHARQNQNARDREE